MTFRNQTLGVLVVEDEPLLAELICDALREDGFSVTTAKSAEEALGHIKADHTFDAMVTDVNLPGGMDGATLARLVRERRPDMPIVYASGAMTEANLRPMVPRSMFVPKPYQVDEVSALLRRMAEPV